MQTSLDHGHSIFQIRKLIRKIFTAQIQWPRINDCKQDQSTFSLSFLNFFSRTKDGSHLRTTYQNRNSKFDVSKIRVDTVREKRIQSPVPEKARRRRIYACLMISAAPTKEDKRFLWGEPRPLSSWNAIGNSLCHWSRTTKTKSVTTNRLIREYTRPTKRIKERGENSDFLDSVNATLGVAVQLVGSITIGRRIQ